MERKDCFISREQGRVFARSIYKDIFAYIQLHKVEFEKYQKEEEEIGRKEAKQQGYGTH